jgi:hypothetical protein
VDEYKYILQPYDGVKSRHHCPACNKPHTFSRYIDTDTGQEIAPNVGRCERLNNCGYLYTPKQYFADTGIAAPLNLQRPKHTPPPPKPPTYIPPEIVEQSLKNYHNNHFATFLNTTFGADAAQQLIARYKIGTSKHWPGATVFWQVDTLGNVRTGKIMLYNPTTGKRIKEPRQCITWAHKLLKQPDFGLKQCLFGEHLLSIAPGQTVCLVESEKTAVIASLYFPQYLWLAVGNLADLSPAKCQAIVKRKVILLPDLKGYDLWQAKAAQISPRWKVSNYLETNASEAEKAQGLDIADYLSAHSTVEFAPAQYWRPSTAIVIQPEPPEIVRNSAVNLKIDFVGTPPPVNWEMEISQLETFFAARQIPAHPVQLSPCETITHPAKFVHSHFEMIKGNNGNPTFLPYLNRLNKLKEILYANTK